MPIKPSSQLDVLEAWGLVRVIAFSNKLRARQTENGAALADAP